LEKREEARAQEAKNNFDPENIVSSSFEFVIDGQGQEKVRFLIKNRAGGFKLTELEFSPQAAFSDFCESDFSEMPHLLFKKNNQSLGSSRNSGNNNGPGGGGPPPPGPNDPKNGLWIKLLEDLDKKSGTLLCFYQKIIEKVFPVKQSNLYVLIGILFVYYSVVTNVYSIVCKCAEIAGLKTPTLSVDDIAKSAKARDARLVEIEEEKLASAKARDTRLVDIAEGQAEFVKSSAKARDTKLVDIAEGQAEFVKSSAKARDTKLVEIKEEKLASAKARDTKLVDIAEGQAEEQRQHNKAMLELAKDKIAKEEFEKLNTLVNNVVSSRFEDPDLIKECNQAFEEIFSNNESPILKMSDDQKKSLSELSTQMHSSLFVKA
jgi:hypothetical protein